MTHKQIDNELIVTTILFSLLRRTVSNQKRHLRSYKTLVNTDTNTNTATLTLTKTLTNVVAFSRLCVCFCRKVSNTTGKLMVTPVCNFDQSDLCADDTMLLDTVASVFVWVGPAANETERTEVRIVFCWFLEFVFCTSLSLSPSAIAAFCSYSCFSGVWHVSCHMSCFCALVCVCVLRRSISPGNWLVCVFFLGGGIRMMSDMPLSQNICYIMCKVVLLVQIGCYLMRRTDIRLPIVASRFFQVFHYMDR